MILRNKEHALAVLELLSREVRNSFGNSSVVLEVYLALSIRRAIRDQYPDRIIGSFDKINLPVDHPSTSPASYAFSRNTMDDQFAGGVVFGSFDISYRYVIPDKIVVSRIGEDLGRIKEPNATWRTLAITGPPGSGKTVTGDLLVRQLSKQLRAIVLVASSSPTMLRTLAQTTELTSKEEVFEALATAVSAEQSMVPSEFRKEKNWEKSLTDTLLERILNVTQPIILAVDNFHLHTQVSDAIGRLRDSSSQWDLRLLLISRTVISPSPEECLFSVPCKLWSHQHAEELLDLWIPKTARFSLIDILTQVWLKYEDEFSLYLIETIAINADKLEKRPTELLRGSIEAHLSSLDIATLGPAKLPPLQTLDRVRQMLKEKKPPESILEIISSKNEIDLVRLFGMLAWFSLYQNESAYAFLDPDKIVDWSGNAIASREIAEDLMVKASKAKIFNCAEGVADWKDMLVADGCAALYLAEEIEDPNVSLQTIARNVTQLELRNSIDFLIFILNPEMVMKILEAGTVTSGFRVSTLRRIVTGGFISRLEDVQGFLIQIGERLLQFGHKTSIYDVEDIAVTLARVARASPEVKRLVDDVISQAQQNANIALAAKAVLVGPRATFFNSVRFAEDHLQPVAVDSAARVWGVDGFEPLQERLAQLSASGHKESNLKGAWFAFLTKQVPSTLINFCHALMSKVSRATASSPFCGVLLESTFQCFLQNTNPADRRVFQDEIRVLRQHLYKSLSLGDCPHLANTLKWLTYQEDSAAVRRDTDWLIRNNYAIPKEPNLPTMTKYAFQSLNRLGDDYGLPHSRELRGLNIDSEHWELVSDRLPRGFRYGDHLQPGQLSVAIQRDGRIATRIVDSSTELTSEFLWRVRLNVPPKSFKRLRASSVVS